ncbi:MAG: hypothetical protein HY372_00790 [Candidatus Andersenbacteria bacterium]|nr:hypothetical protein [Candidatus Andersenbacteria bacterium]
MKEESFTNSNIILLRQGYTGQEIRNSKQIKNSNSRNQKHISDFGFRASDLREYPQYTKPADYKGWKVPEVLLSGNHEEIRRWREAQRRWT